MKKFLSLIAIILTLCFFCGCENLMDSQSVYIQDINHDETGLILHFINVDQGDCTLVESKGRFALIDAGEQVQSNKVVSYLTSVGVKTLDYIIATHPHSDHVGGLADVIRNFDTEVLICPDADTTSSIWENVLDAADERNVTYEPPTPYEFYQLGGSTITVLSPEPDEVYSNLNDYSIVCMVEYGNNSALLTGDAEKTVERKLTQGSYDLSADILKCGHHGSSTSSCMEFLQMVNPSAAIISCGKYNTYGHPHKETTQTLDLLGIPYWRTDKNSDIAVAFDGDNISIYTSEGKTTLSPVPKQESVSAYIGNKNSKVIHRTVCEAVTKMSDRNKVFFDTYKEAKEKGYSPCGTCNP